MMTSFLLTQRRNDQRLLLRNPNASKNGNGTKYNFHKDKGTQAAAAAPSNPDPIVGPFYSKASGRIAE
jgi:hypothetical protein